MVISAFPSVSLRILEFTLAHIWIILPGFQWDPSLKNKSWPPSWEGERPKMFKFHKWHQTQQGGLNLHNFFEEPLKLAHNFCYNVSTAEVSCYLSLLSWKPSCCGSFTHVTCETHRFGGYSISEPSSCTHRLTVHASFLHIIVSFYGCKGRQHIGPTTPTHAFPTNRFLQPPGGSSLRFEVKTIVPSWWNPG